MVKQPYIFAAFEIVECKVDHFTPFENDNGIIHYHVKGKEGEDFICLNEQMAQSHAVNYTVLSVISQQQPGLLSDLQDFVAANFYFNMSKEEVEIAMKEKQKEKLRGPKIEIARDIPTDLRRINND